MRNFILSIGALVALGLSAGTADAQIYRATWVSPYYSGGYYSTPFYTGYYGYATPRYYGYYPRYYGGYYGGWGYYRPGVSISIGYPYGRGYWGGYWGRGYRWR